MTPHPDLVEPRRLAKMELQAEPHVTYLAHSEVKLLAQAFLDSLVEVERLSVFDGDPADTRAKQYEAIRELRAEVERLQGELEREREYGDVLARKLDRRVVAPPEKPEAS